MGCDIHIITEVNKDGKWEHIEEVPTSLDNRNYPLFTFLAGVRDYFNGKGFEPKGKCEDASDYTKEQFEYDSGDYTDFHSHSYLTLKELKESDKSDYYAHKYRVSYNLIDEFEKHGGKWPEGFKVELNTSDNFENLIALKLGYVEAIVSVENKPTEEELESCSLQKGINELEELSKKYNVTDENIRIVFCFDN